MPTPVRYCFLLLACLLGSSLVRGQENGQQSGPKSVQENGQQGDQQAGLPRPLTIISNAGHLVITQAASFYIDTIPRSRAGTAQDLATVNNKPFDIPWLQFLDLINRAPRSYTFWMQAGLQNNSDSTLELSLAYGQTDFVDVWAGASFVSGGWLRAEPPKASYLQRQSQTLPLRLGPHETVRLVARLRELTDNYSFAGLALYDKATLGAEAVRGMAADNANLILQMLFEGFLLCQLLYVLSQWLIIRRREYLYYLLYITLIGLYFLSKQEPLFGRDLLFTRWPLLKVYFGKTLLILPYFVYFRFVRSFLDIPRDYPQLNRWIKAAERFLLLYALTDFIYMVLTLDTGLQIRVYTVVFALIFLVTIGFIIYLVRYRQPLVYFILGGSLIVATGHITGLVVSYFEYVRHIDLGVPDIFIFSQTGIVLEVVCFTAGLSYKNRKTEKEKIAGQERLIEQLKANELLQTRMQHIRNKIAQDLHDDIGSTLSSISILSDLAIRGSSGSQSLETMNEIKDSSLLLMERMDDIVWSINPRNDSLENLLMRVRHFATTLFEAKGIEYSIEIQQRVHEVRLPIEYRQHIYLVLKEAINNLVKYARADQAFIEVSFDQRHLHLCIRDNGCGFAPEAATRGNGITGMQRRAELMNARVSIDTAPGAGTAIRLEVALAEVGEGH